jgi:hypothetical protein
MESTRIRAIQRKLTRNKDLVRRSFAGLGGDGWNRTVYQTPFVWTVRDVLAHLVSAEQALRGLAENIAAGGRGAPDGFDYNEFNRKEQDVHRSRTPQELLPMFLEARERTVDWAGGLNDGQLDRTGGHPALGELSVEGVLTAIQAHTLMHLTELKHPS